MDTVIIVVERKGKEYLFEFYLGSNMDRLGDCNVGNTSRGKKQTCIFVSWFGIEDNYQKQGYGRICYSTVEKYLSQLGYSRFRLTSLDKSRPFWRKMGYKGKKGDTMYKHL